MPKELLLSSIKRYFRNRQAVFWSLFFPLLIIVIFGVMNLDSFGDVKLGLVDQVHDSQSRALVEAFGQVEMLDIREEGGLAEQKALLDKGDLDLIMMIPRRAVARSDTPRTNIQLYYNGEPSQEVGIARLVVQRILDEITLQQYGVSSAYRLEEVVLSDRSLGYMDFLIPGAVAMSIMQLGMFSVAFAFVDLKKRGVLRRLLVTPINPVSFLVSETLTRLMMLVLQVVVLLTVGVLVFKLNIVGSLASMLLVGGLGGMVFLLFGFAVAGYASDERQAAPISNIFTMPMMFLSGVFFSTEGMPVFLQNLSSYLPLTYLVDALREIANNGATLSQVVPDLVGLSSWGVLALVLAVKMFRWE